MKKNRTFPDSVVQHFHARCQQLSENLMAERGTAMRVYHVSQDLKYIRDTGTHAIDGFDLFYPWVWAKYRIKKDQADLYLSCAHLKAGWLEDRRGSVKEMAIVGKIAEPALHPVLIDAMHEGARCADLRRGRDHGELLIRDGHSRKEAAAQARLVALGQHKAKVQKTTSERAHKSIGRIHQELTTLTKLVEQGHVALDVGQLTDVFQKLRKLLADAGALPVDGDSSDGDGGDPTGDPR